jgi:glycosyltransferase involved in cell wall biosynthesis
MLNVAYFSNQFADLQGHGLARYSRELFQALNELADAPQINPVASWSSLPQAGVQELANSSGLQLLPWGRRLTPLCWNFLNYPPLERWTREEPDVVHAVAMGYPVATRKPLVVTVHDLGPLTHPEYFTGSGSWIMRRSLRQTVEQAAAIICVSESTADELLGFVGNAVQERIVVIPEGVSDSFFEPVDMGCLDTLNSLPDADTPFLLSTGKLSPRKNVHGVIQALGRVADKIPHHLVLVGGDGWSTEEIYRQVADTGLENRIHFAGFVSDEQLRALYRQASGYVHPSLYEGFGLTVLEAMAAQCPVVTSNVYSLPEVAGDAALLVDPHSVEEMAEAILQLCTDTALARRLREDGLARARTYTWRDCAKNVAQVYRKVAAL